MSASGARRKRADDWFFIVGSVETAWVAIAIMTAGNTLGAAVTGGFAVNHMDVAPKYAGTLMGITNTAGTIPGIIGVTITGMILEQTGSWALVFGSLAILSTLLYAYIRYLGSRPYGSSPLDRVFSRESEEEMLARLREEQREADVSSMGSAWAEMEKVALRLLACSLHGRRW